MAKVLAKDLEACVDCLMVIANADYSGMSDDRGQEVDKGIMRAVSGWNDNGGPVLFPVLVVTCGEDCEGWFSMSSCDICRSPLGGDRHPVAIIA